eukprot:642223-Rhodomonas_salina.1
MRYAVLSERMVLRQNLIVPSPTAPASALGLNTPGTKLRYPPTRVLRDARYCSCRCIHVCARYVT